MLGISETINLLLSLQAKQVKIDFILFYFFLLDKMLLRVGPFYL